MACGPDDKLRTKPSSPARSPRSAAGVPGFWPSSPAGSQRVGL